MPRTAKQDVEEPVNTTAKQDVEEPAVDQSARIAELEKQLAEATAAKEDAEIKKLEAEQAAEITKRVEKEEAAIDPEDKKILDALKEGKSAEIVADKLGIERSIVIRVAFENMNGESVYELADRLGVKANDVYKAADMHDMVRQIQYVDDNGKRRLKELDYEA